MLPILAFAVALLNIGPDSVGCHRIAATGLEGDFWSDETRRSVRGRITKNWTKRPDTRTTAERTPRRTAIPLTFQTELAIWTAVVFVILSWCFSG